MSTITYTGKLTVTTCWCGMTYAIPEALYSHVLNQFNNGRQQNDIFCPLGHKWSFAGDGEAILERRRANQLERKLANRDEDLRAERASHAATKGQLTKTKQRAERGVCLHCKRSFVNVAKHVEHMHPELVTP
jgi:hypothetical protein